MFKNNNRIGCLIPILLIVFNLTVGIWSVNTVFSFFGIILPSLAVIIIGYLIGELFFPIAIIGLIIKLLLFI